MICFDSKYALHVVQQSWQANSHLEVADLLANSTDVVVTMLRFDGTGSDVTREMSGMVLLTLLPRLELGSSGAFGKNVNHVIWKPWFAYVRVVCCFGDCYSLSPPRFCTRFTDGLCSDLPFLVRVSFSSSQSLACKPLHDSQQLSARSTADRQAAQASTSKNGSTKVLVPLAHVFELVDMLAHSCLVDHSVWWEGRPNSSAKTPSRTYVERGSISGRIEQTVVGWTQSAPPFCHFEPSCASRGGVLEVSRCSRSDTSKERKNDVPSAKLSVTFVMLSKLHLRFGELLNFFRGESGEWVSRGFKDQFWGIIKSLLPNGQVCLLSATKAPEIIDLTTKLARGASCY